MALPHIQGQLRYNGIRHRATSFIFTWDGFAAMEDKFNIFLFKVRVNEQGALLKKLDNRWGTLTPAPVGLQNGFTDRVHVNEAAEVGDPGTEYVMVKEDTLVTRNHATQHQNSYDTPAEAWYNRCSGKALTSRCMAPEGVNFRCNPILPQSNASGPRLTRMVLFSRVCLVGFGQHVGIKRDMANSLRAIAVMVLAIILWPIALFTSEFTAPYQRK